MDDNTLTPNLPDGVAREEADAVESTWQALGAIEAPAAPSERMRARLDAVIQTFEDARRPHPIRQYAVRGLAAAAVLIIGMAIGRYTAGSAFGGIRPTDPTSYVGRVPPKADPPDSAAQIAAMRSEVHDLREMVSLSLMQQQSASERIKGVSWTGRIDQPSDQMVASLLDTLMHDPNVNVRLATIDALERSASRDDVRQGTIEAIDRQASPLVQIALIDFMVKTNERDGVPTLRRLAMDPQADRTVRARAQWGLQQLG